MSRVNVGQGVWRDPEVKGYFMKDLSGEPGILKYLTGMPESLVIRGVRLHRKDEIHATLIAPSKAADSDERLEQAIIQTSSDWLQADGNRLSFDGFTGKVWVCEKTKDNEHRVSVIAGVAIAGAAKLWDAVREACPNFQNPVLHVTIFKSDRYGIGIHTPEDLTDMCTLDADLATQLLSRS